MSVQFGRWSFDGAQASPEYLAKVRKLLAPYGPDGGTSYSNGGADLLYHAFHTTKESRLGTQPHVSASGTVVTWDGRLDNRADVIGLLRGPLSIQSPDVAIAASAYERWGTDCFAKLIGDWALSVWNPKQRILVLAKDPVGTRHLYYSVEKDRLTWSTILDPLILLAGKPFQLEEEYIAGWFSFFPATHLTPYVGIHSVPPSSFVLTQEGKCTTRKYWDFDPERKIRYRSDAEYEEHFRVAFAQSVGRRLRSDRPILAELSGGMDSSSIVCMADRVIACGGGETPGLDTLSYYNDSEPNWNERPYFTKVEEQRGRAGCHIDVSVQETFDFEAVRFETTPCSGRCPTTAGRLFARCLRSRGNRIVLSGTGGDEIMGGVPTPLPELMDLLAAVRLRDLVHRLKLWALDKRTPWLHLLADAARGFLPSALAGTPKHKRPAEWLDSRFIKRHRVALTGYESRLKLVGPLPSFQENIRTLEMLRRQLECSALPSEPPHERRYPYLDRDLLELIYAIPREQLVRPGQRRSLMRRALAGIVPDEVLNRKRKAFVSRSPMAAVSAASAHLVGESRNMIVASIGAVDADSFSRTLQKARHGQSVPLVTLLRTLGIEYWLRGIRARGIIASTAANDLAAFGQVSVATRSLP